MPSSPESPLIELQRNFFSPGLRIFFWWPVVLGGLFGLVGGSAWFMVGGVVGLCIAMVVAVLLLLNLFW